MANIGDWRWLNWTGGRIPPTGGGIGRYVEALAHLQHHWQ